MLVLTRKATESIMIGDDIEVMVLSNDGARVRLGIQAPASVSVHRKEIYLEIQVQGRDEDSHDEDSQERHDLKRAQSSKQSL